ncbi:MAG: calcium/proton exchanger Cax [Pseudonocardiales bacterium]|nr:calcium/proton exchanger Cax [Pseudonocardiales bacterium]
MASTPTRSSGGPTPAGGPLALVSSADRRLGLLTLALTVVAALVRPVADILEFIVAGAALALLAACVGRAVDALGDRVGPALTGLVQSAFGNLPELLILIFALHAGLITVVQATIVGSILANVALVLGVAFIAGGLKHGPQRFPGASARTLGLTILLAVAALAVPSLTAHLHTAAGAHERVLSEIVSVVLLIAFMLSVVDALRPAAGPGDPAAADSPVPPNSADVPPAAESPARWPLALAAGVLAVTGIMAALVSDWFVAALTPAMRSLHISDAFAGLVIVAIAGNAVENFVGIQLALKNRTEHALQVVLQSPVQIAMVVAPVVLLLSPVLGAPGFTLVLPPLLLASLLISALLAVFITYDGESTWYEGVVLVALYSLLAAAFWWG